ncbi:hypothetical protein C8Q70DRAFT_652536 [Cubamyces menziesii]|uniref:Uncharacterized protein n=1 Tax=Trametes cubensis TaxID=1111947 RepID=A0AAD7X5Y2_9APHY|nr:hypothetical protein C8Q70DRAFT_652536 [Cubamyces menziesii]KAJ8456898.1 hypothetical protein ONZ51_g11847 [Trametes cubensis]
MKAFTALVSVCAIVAGSYALLTPREVSSVCAGAQAVQTSAIDIGSGKTVELTTFSCDHPAVHANDDPSPTSVAPSAPLPTNNVCGELCSNVCGDSGNLPPVTEDCETIVNAITILNGSISPSFEVDPDHVQTLSFGTCRFFFENFSPFPMSNCWLSFVQIASAAADACLPPVQPVNSEGLCVASDATWRIGVAHS